MIAQIRKNLTHLPVAVVFFAAAYQSFGHTVEVSSRYGEADSAWLMPLSIDGLMIVASRYVTHARNTAARIAALLVFVAAAGAMLMMNYLAADPNAIARIVAMLPALAMIAAGALLHWAPQRTTVKRRRPAARKPTTNVRPIRASKAA
jgi:hypothetical protein